MKTINAVNVNEAYPIGLAMLLQQGVSQPSRYGETLEMTEPVSVMYANPCERVLFDEVRDANPFLHFFEALWIIAGRSDVAFLRNLVPRMGEFSDDGSSYHGAYGKRLRDHGDQIDEVILRLRGNPDDRRCVMQIYEASDLWYEGKDTPCNVTVALKIRNGRLNMHVFNRSNDFVWGLTGANVVQFSTLQEYIAGMVGVPVGVYHQTTDSMHVYDNEQWKTVSKSINFQDPYAGGVKPYPMMANCAHGMWHDDLHDFFDAFDYDRPFLPLTPYFKEVVAPMWDTFMAWQHYKESGKHPDLYAEITKHVVNIQASDWRLAVASWLDRRYAK